MKSLSLRWIFILAFLFLILLTVVISVLDLRARQQLLNEFITLSEESAPTVIALNQVNNALLRLETEAVRLALEDVEGAYDLRETQIALQEFEISKSRVEYWLNQYGKFDPDNAERLRVLTTEVVTQSDQLVRVGRFNSDPEAITAKRQALEEAEDTYFSLFYSILDREQTRFDQKRNTAIETTEQTQTRSILLLGSSTVGALLIGLFLSFHTVTPIVRLKNIATSVSAGSDERAENFPNNEIGVLADEFNHMADVLQQKVIEAKSANEFKTQLLARVSHELRTPLGAIMGMGGILAEDGLKPEQKVIAKHILNYADELQDLVDELLEQSRWEISGRGRELHLSEIFPQKILDDAALRVKYRAEDKGVQVITQYDNLPSVICADEAKLRQVLNNLLTNAIKFTEEGNVTLRGYVPKPGQWAFDVTDTGMGIDEGAREYIFEPFRQADESNTRSYGGVGLGLSIVKQFVTLMGGTITVSSVHGEGSTFTVILPAEIIEKEIIL